MEVHQRSSLRSFSGLLPMAVDAQKAMKDVAKGFSNVWTNPPAKLKNRPVECDACRKRMMVGPDRPGVWIVCEGNDTRQRKPYNKMGVYDFLSLVPYLGDEAAIATARKAHSESKYGRSVVCVHAADADCAANQGRWKKYCAATLAKGRSAFFLVPQRRRGAGLRVGGRVARGDDDDESSDDDAASGRQPAARRGGGGGRGNRRR